MIYICIPSDSDGRVCLQFRRPVFDPWVGKVFWRRELQATPVFLPGEFHGQRSLVAYSPWGHRAGHDWETNTHIWYVWKNKCILFQKTMLGEDFKAGKQPWNISHLPVHEQLLKGLWRGCGGGVPERGECQEPDFLQLHLKMEPSARPVFQPLGKDRSFVFFSDLFKSPLKCLCRSQF